MTSAIIRLATNQKFNFSKLIFDSQIRNLDNASGKFLMYPRFVQIFLDRHLKDFSAHNRIYIATSHAKKVSENMKRVGKEHVIDEAVYKELDDSLVRAVTIASSLEPKQDNGAKIPGGIQLLKLDASKQERKIHDIDVDEDITLVNDQDDAEIFDVDDLHGEEVFVDKDDVDKEVNDEVQKVFEEAVEDINTVKLIVDVAQVNVTDEVNDASIATTVSAAATITTEEVTLAKALVELKASKPKAKWVVIQEPTKRVEEKRNKPPTQAQKRKIMCTYLKNMEGYTLKQLKSYEFDKIQEMFDRALKRVNTFEPIRSELVEGKEKKA
uniref:Uncharacterized protein n=1 Tax=Tanacetum cinerariifolium TaxID=118510 RepID=A0A699GL67_TANCI|nr:hypothetical protein [Tanacetum cinerariifolium]